MKLIMENWRQFLTEGIGIIGYHVTNENNREGIVSGGIRGSQASMDDINPDYGEKRVYFFSDQQMDRGLEKAKMAMFEKAIIGNPEPPYIIIPINLKKVPGEKKLDPELAKSDMYGENAYYLVGDVPPEAVIASHIKHEDEFKKEPEEY